MINTKRIMLFLISLLMMISVSGCAKEVKQTNQELTVYIGFMESEMENAVAAYKQLYPNIKVNVKRTKATDPYDSQYRMDEELSFLSELMNGEGADVFMLGYFWDMDKVLESGVLADLSELYDGDTALDKENYNQVVMDSALYKGERLYIPLTYSIPLLLSTKSVLAEEGFNINNCKDFESFRQETEKWKKDRNSERRLFRIGKTAKYSLVWAGYNLVDLETKEIKLESEEIKDYFEWCKDILKEDKGDFLFGDLLGASSLRDGKILFANQLDFNTYDNIVRNSRAISTFDEPVLVPVRNQTGGLTALIQSSVGVRGNSPNKQNAYNFIKVLLSEEVQKTPGTQIRGSIPVSYKIMEEIVYPPTSNTTFGEEREGFPVMCPEFTREQQDKYMGYAKEVNKASFVPKWNSELMRAMKPYFNDELSYEECIKQAKEKVEMYLSE